MAQTIRIVEGIAGLLIVFLVLWDAFESIVLPRRVTRPFRIVRFFYLATWRPWASLARRVGGRKRREAVLAYFGPLSLLLLLAFWAAGLIFGFALMHQAFTTLVSQEKDNSFYTRLYFSGTTFFTLGLGDVFPQRGISRLLTVAEAGMGFGFLAAVIGYLPVIYQAFSRREASIALLDARAGSPSSAVVLLARYGEADALSRLEEFLAAWERWSAELLETQISYPVLAYYRSQHDNQSWLMSLTTLLDLCTLVIMFMGDGPRWQAELTFAMARHAVVDLAQVLNAAPERCHPDRLPDATLRQVRAKLAPHNILIKSDPQSARKLEELRELYEPYVYALSKRLLIPLPEWLPEEKSKENWRTSAWRNASAPAPEFIPEDVHLD